MLKGIKLLLAFAVFAVLPGPAWSASGEERVATVEEIVVTARKREEPLQETLNQVYRHSHWLG